MLSQIVDERPGITLADLRLAASSLSTDAIHIAIAKQEVYVDLAVHRLSESERVPVFRDREIARAMTYRGIPTTGHPWCAHPVLVTQGSALTWDGKAWRIANVGETEMTLLGAEQAPFALPYSAFEKLLRTGKIVGGQQELPSSITPGGRAFLEPASEMNLATAIFRNRVINPEH